MPATLKSAASAAISHALQDQERQTFLPREKALMVSPEIFREAVAAELLRLNDAEQFQEKSRELHDVILRAPRMPIAAPHGEAEPPVERRGRVEIAHGMNDVIEAARHGLIRHRRACPGNPVEEGKAFRRSGCAGQARA